MNSCSYARLLPVSRQRLLRRFVSHSAHPPPRQQAIDTPPTPSQITRFSLTGTTLQSSLDRVLKNVFLDGSPSILPPLWSRSLQRVPDQPNGLALGDIKDGKVTLRRLRLIVESKVHSAEDALLLQRAGCSFIAQALESSYRTSAPTEVISTLHAVISRIHNLGAPISKELHILGMFYSSLYCMASALQWHLQRYAELSPGKLDPKTSTAVVNALQYSLTYKRAQSPKHDPNAMRTLVTGEGVPESPLHCSLHNQLPWDGHDTDAKFLGQYMSLLVMLKSKSTLDTVWHRTLYDQVSGGGLSRFQAAYQCVETLIHTGKKKKALKFLEDVSKCANGTLPGLSDFRGLSSLLQTFDIQSRLLELSGQEEYLNILQSQLEHVEKRLGVNWDPESSSHTIVGDRDAISHEKPLATIDEPGGLGSSERLVAEIQALGCMRSWSNLGRIGDLLDEYEGSQIPVQLSSNKFRGRKLFWVLQRCPVRFAESKNPLLITSIPRSWTAATLGLIRVKPMGYYHPTQEPFLLLMGLGYLVVESKSSDGVRRLEETGHIVAWDRVFGQYLIVQTRDRDSVNRHQKPHSSEVLPHLDDIARIKPVGCSNEQELPTPFLGCQKQNFLFEINAGRGISP